MLCGGCATVCPVCSVAAGSAMSVRAGAGKDEGRASCLALLGPGWIPADAVSSMDC